MKCNHQALYLNKKSLSNHMRVCEGLIKNGYKGNNVGIIGLHRWIEKRLIKPPICPNCRKKGLLDLSNKNHTYKRTLEDWEWLCRRCHMEKDGRLKKFVEFSQNRPFNWNNKKYWKERKVLNY